MRHSIRQFVITALLVVSPLCFLPAGWAGSLANGQEPFFGKGFSAALLGASKSSHDDLRSFQKLIASLRKAEKNILDWGIPLDRPVKIMLFTDTEFPTRDVWKAAGVTPTAANLDAFAEENSLVFAAMSGYEMAHADEALMNKWFYLRAISLPKKYQAQAKEIKGEALDGLLTLIKEKRARLEANLSKTMQEAQADYVMFDNAAYGFPLGTIWVPVRKAGDLHRYLDTIVHEFGHHAFYQMTVGVLGKNKSQKKWTRMQTFYAARNLLALNEMFADYTAVSSGHNMCISVHNYRSDLPQDFKRYFSQDRTLPDFVEKATKGTKLERMVLGEGHNSLNPSRSLLWKLKIALGTDKTDRLFVAAARNQVLNYFAKELPELKKKSVQSAWGCFEYTGYPVDVLSENLRFMRFLQAEADRQLTAAEKDIFAAEAKKIFLHHYPLKFR